MQDFHEFIDAVLVDEKTIEGRVAEPGAHISRAYADKELLIVCLLRGGLTFTADLTRHLTIPLPWIACRYPGMVSGIMPLAEMSESTST